MEGLVKSMACRWMDAKQERDAQLEMTCGLKQHVGSGGMHVRYGMSHIYRRRIYAADRRPRVRTEGGR